MHNLKDIINKHQNFTDKFRKGGQYLYKDLEKGQSPKTMIISCCDSRVCPTDIFDAKPGDLFVVRNVANLVPSFDKKDDYSETFTAIEYAVKNLNVQNIIVMGHTNCGGIQACLDQNKSVVKDTTQGTMEKYLSILKDTARNLLKRNPNANDTTLRQAMECDGVRNSLKNLMSFPFIAERMAKDKINIYGAHFDIKDGNLYVLNTKSNTFDNIQKIKKSASKAPKQKPFKPYFSANWR